MRKPAAADTLKAARFNDLYEATNLFALLSGRISYLLIFSCSTPSLGCLAWGTMFPTISQAAQQFLSDVEQQQIGIHHEHRSSIR
jgi:hypothetical protein